MAAELVLALGQCRMPGCAVVQAFVDIGLQMLGAETYREGLAFQRQPLPMQNSKGVAGAVTHRQNQLLTGDVPGSGGDARQAPAAHGKPGQGGVEAHLPAQGLDLGADIADNAPQQIGTHMGLLPPRNVGRGAVRQKGFGHKPAKGVPRAGGQLAVRKRPGAALAKLNVGIRVQLAGGFKTGNGAHALIQRGTALQNQRAVAAACQKQGGKQPGGTQPDHDRAMHQRCAARGKVVLGCGGKADAGNPGKGSLLPFIRQGHRDGIYQHGLAAAGIHRKPGYPAAGSLRAVQPQKAQRLGDSLGIGVTQGER